MTRISVMMTFAAMACGVGIAERLTVVSILGLAIVSVIVVSILEVIVARRRKTDG